MLYNIINFIKSIWTAGVATSLRCYSILALCVLMCAMHNFTPNFDMQLAEYYEHARWKRGLTILSIISQIKFQISFFFIKKWGEWRKRSNWYWKWRIAPILVMGVRFPPLLLRLCRKLMLDWCEFAVIGRRSRFVIGAY